MNDQPIGPDLRRDHRASMLHFASNLTTRTGDPGAVAANAAVLQAWYDVGSTPSDKRDRFAALHRADLNRSYKRLPDDTPQLLIAEAEVYYAFLKAA